MKKNVSVMCEKNMVLHDIVILLSKSKAENLQIQMLPEF